MDDLLPLIKSHFDSCYPQEGCGVIVFTGSELKWVPCENQSSSKDDFVICPHVYSKLLIKYRIYGIVHNHIYHPPYPSVNDRKYCNELAVPFFIFNYPTMEMTKLYPDSMNLLGRTYAWEIYDCLTLVLDYYAINKHIILDVPRIYKDDWWKVSSDNYLTDEHLSNWGFVPTKSPVSGDLITFKMSAKVPNHIGILLTKDDFLHHAHNRLSTIENLYPIWGPNIEKFYSYVK